MIKTVFVKDSVVVGLGAAHQTGVSFSAPEGITAVDVSPAIPIEVGWGAAQAEDGAWTFTASAPPPPNVSPAAFYTLFKPQEMIDIEASSDPMVKQFYKRWEVAMQGGKDIDLAVPSIASSLEYLSLTQVDANPTKGRTYITPERIAEIRGGKQQ